MKKIFYIVMMLTAGLWITSCSEEMSIGQTSTDSVPPSPLSGVDVEELPGGAKITYVLPKEKDISYVKGELESQGKRRVIRSSVYDNFLIVDGLGSTDPVEITLTLIDHSENASEPVKKTFTPGKPPIEIIFETMTLTPDWGGVLLQWNNPTAVEIGVTLFALDSLGEYDKGQTYFTLANRHIFRGYEAVERKFGVQITDKWNNVSPIKEQTLTPVFEKLLSRLKYKQKILPYDNSSDNGGGQVFSKIMDGQKTNTGMNSWHTKENQPSDQIGYTMPVLFTLDLGVEAILNRFILWQGRYSETFLYAHHNPKTFEIWGTTEIPTDKPNEYWREDWKNDWIQLGDLEIIKPSGLPLGTRSDADNAAANAGHEFYVPNERIRYVRFSVTSTWIGNRDNTVTLHELEFYGNDNLGN
jgi:hypothetical protein